MTSSGGEGGQIALEPSQYPDDFIMVPFTLTSTGTATANWPVFYCDRPMVLDHAYFREGTVGISLDGDFTITLRKCAATEAGNAGTALTTAISAHGLATATIANTPVEMTVDRTQNIIAAGEIISLSAVVTGTVGASTNFLLCLRLRSHQS